MPSPGVTLPGPFVTAPSPVPPVASCWLLTSARDAEFEQGVLYGCGPAQVGFGVQLSSFHRLTLSSGGRLSPEPLRLTRPSRALWHLGVKDHRTPETPSGPIYGRPEHSHARVDTYGLCTAPG